MITYNRKAFTFVEVCMTVLVLSMIFGVGAGVMSYARRESEKGLWIQQGITQLRNATRQIGVKMKEMSYPSTLVSRVNGANTVKDVISFKEMRDYDNGGRLRNLVLNSCKDYEMYVQKNADGKVAGFDKQAVIPEANEKVIMIFPICESEKDIESGYTPGRINWVRFVLKPSPVFESSKRGQIVMEEYEQEYDTRSASVYPNRAFSLKNQPFSVRDCRLLRQKVIIEDVSGVEINSYDVSHSRGHFVTKTGVKSEDYKQIKNIVTFKIYITHPKDDKIRLDDIVTVTSGVEVINL